MSETALYEDDGLSGGAELPDSSLAEFDPLAAVLPDRHGSSWFLGNDVPLRFNDGFWATARARSSEALDALREALPGDWVNW